MRTKRDRLFVDAVRPLGHGAGITRASTWAWGLTLAMWTCHGLPTPPGQQLLVAEAYFREPSKDDWWKQTNEYAYVVHTCMHACTGTLARYSVYINYLQNYMHTCIHTYLHTYIPTYRHTYIPTYLPALPACLTYLPTYHIPTYLHTYLPTYLHTYIHTHKQTS